MPNYTLFPASIIWMTFLLPCVWAQDTPLPPTKIFLIGNSLTQDTLPPLLDGYVEWHIDCGKNLQTIYDNPQSPCVKSSVSWPDALKTQRYDILCVQPHFGTTLQQDINVISAWLKMQPKADLVIHTGWNRSKEFEPVYHATLDHDRMVHAPGYFAKLTAELTKRFPDRSIRSTQAIAVLDDIYHDITQSQAPFKSFDELYRDDIHLQHQVGRYLAHNLMRIALGQPIGNQGFQVEPVHQHYFDHKLEAIQATINAER